MSRIADRFKGQDLAGVDVVVILTFFERNESRTGRLRSNLDWPIDDAIEVWGGGVRRSDSFAVRRRAGQGQSVENATRLDERPRCRGGPAELYPDRIEVPRSVEDPPRSG